MSDSIETISECTTTGDMMFVDSEDFLKYVIDTENKKIYQFYPVRADQNKRTKVKETNDGSLELVAETINSDIPYKQRKEYKTNSRYWKVEPVTRDELYNTITEILQKTEKNNLRTVADL